MYKNSLLFFGNKLACSKKYFYLNKYFHFFKTENTYTKCSKEFRNLTTNIDILTISLKYIHRISIVFPVMLMKYLLQMKILLCKLLKKPTPIKIVRSIITFI